MQEAGLTEDEISAGIHITEEFLDVLSGLLLNVAFAKIALEGGNRVKAPLRAPEHMPGQYPDHPERAA